MDQIAEATKSSKATLYRQWGSKSALVVEALRCAGETEQEAPDTGSLRGDLLAMVDRAEGEEHDADLLTAIMHAIRQDDELAEAVRTQILEPGREQHPGCRRSGRSIAARSPPTPRGCRSSTYCSSRRSSCTT